MESRRFIQCDVFSSVPTLGNALAVVVDGQGLSEKSMQQFAAWTNLAETTYILPPSVPEADYRLRIFTPTREMLFAGHPTLGSCAAWLHSGGIPGAPGVVRQECGVGIVEIDISDPDKMAFKAPPTVIEPMDAVDYDAITKALKIPHDIILNAVRLENGPIWQVLELNSADAVLAVDSSLVRWPVFNAIGLIGAHSAEAECDYEVRMLAPSSGMSEDPITGSLNSAIGHWLSSENRLQRDIVVAQGTVIGRRGRVTIRPILEPNQIQIAGKTNILIQGVVIL